MSEYCKKAKEKLDKEQKAVNGQKETVMAPAVKMALLDFCQQDEEFARAIVEGGSFDKCMKKVADGVGNSISDLEAYKKAVSFYFPGAGISMKMTIDLCDSVKDAKHIDGPGIVLNLSDFM